MVLFLCVHNSGRSVAARILLEHHGGDRVEARSGGSEPGLPVDEVRPIVDEIDRRVRELLSEL